MLQRGIAAVFAAAVLLVGSAADADPPHFSSVILPLAVNQQQCLANAQVALNNSGFGGVTQNNNFVYGSRGDYRAAIFCAPTPSAVIIVMGPQFDPADAFVTVIRDRF